MLSAHLEVGMTKARGWRKIAASVWGWPKDPQVYGGMDFQAGPVLEAIETIRERTVGRRRRHRRGGGFVQEVPGEPLGPPGLTHPTDR